MRPPTWFAFPKIVETTKKTLQADTRARFRAVNDFLIKKFASEWATRSNCRLEDPIVDKRSSQWEFYLQANMCLRPDPDMNRNLPSDLRLEASNKQIDNRTIYFVSGGDPVAQDLARAWHPKFYGRTLNPTTADEHTLENIKLATQLLETVQHHRNFYSDHVEAITIVGSSPSLTSGECISLTSKLVPGLIYLSPCPQILMAESIIHESAHLFFTGYERNFSLYSDLSIRIKTPLRDDSRHLSGYLHQMVVLRFLLNLYQCFLNQNPSVVARQRDKVEKRLSVHYEDFKKGVEGSVVATTGLSTDGRDLLQRLCDPKHEIIF